MRIRGKRVADVVATDIAALIEAGVGESRQLEFKSELPTGRDEDKREFLADVASMANTAGGVILYGVATGRSGTGQDNGIAASVSPIVGLNVDKERLRLLAMLQDGVSPALASQVTIVEIVVPDVSGSIVALGVPRSLSGPHMVSFQRRHQFWRRSESGKYLPDVAEVRSMFLESREWQRELEAFRDERLKILSSGQVPVPSTEPGCLVHVLPLGRMEAHLDLGTHEAALNQGLPPLRHYGWSSRFNASGFLTYTNSATAPHATISYSQCFRFGGVEGFTSSISSEGPEQRGGTTKRLFAPQLRGSVRDFVDNAIKVMEGPFGLEPPFGILLSLVRVRGCAIPTQDGYHLGSPIDVDELRVPAIVIESGQNPHAAMQYAYDILWQASGFAGAPSHIAA